MKWRIHSAVVSWVIVLALDPSISLAQVNAYPEKSVRFIVPFPAGAANDTLARAIGQKLADRWQRPVIIDNRGGAGGVLGTTLASKAIPDGYTIVLVPATHAINVSLYSKPPFDAVKDFAPISLVATGAYMLVANPLLPAKTAKELISLAKAKPGQLSYGSAGTGNATHLVGELMSNMAGIKMTHVPYKGVGPALIEVMGGQVNMMFGSISATNPQVKAGRVTALAVTSIKRSGAAPNVPTLDESGLTGFDAVGWWGVLAPAKTPAAIIREINSKIESILQDPEMRVWLQSQGFEPAGGDARMFARFISDEIRKWGEVVKASGAKLE
jgi:tripartite-type tricarboxylate transporter receptor subunit TctC